MEKKKITLRDIGGLLYYTYFQLHYIGCDTEKIYKDPYEIPEEFLDREVTALRAVNDPRNIEIKAFMEVHLKDKTE